MSFDNILIMSCLTSYEVSAGAMLDENNLATASGGSEIIRQGARFFNGSFGDPII